MNRYLCLSGKQAGKFMLTSIWKGTEIIGALKIGVVTVNAIAQRSLAKGANTTPTHQLLDQEKVHETPRMKDFVQFLHRVMDKVEAGDVSEGFLGAVLMIIPEDFTDAHWSPMDGDKVGMEAQNRVGILTVDEAGVGRAAFHLGDGQGRFFALYSMEFIAKKHVAAKLKEIEKARKAKKDTRQLELDVAELQALLERVQKFVRGIQLAVVCYAKACRDDGTLVGLDVKAQQRLFIEGNALNSRASKEAQLKFDSVSPVSTALYLLRIEPEFFWMDPDYIEENSKSIAKGSSKLFTLSTLTQAYGWSVANTTKVQRLDAEMYEMVGKRREFVEAFWRKVGEVFESLWRRPDTWSDGEWLDFLIRRRAEQNVALQAIFLQALGRFGYNLGKSVGWNAESSDWQGYVEALAPKGEGGTGPGKVDYRAFRGRLADTGTDGKKEWVQVSGNLAADFDPRWTSALMKPRTGKDDKGKPSSTIVGYSFNNVRDSVVKTYEILVDLAGVPDMAEVADDGDEAIETTEVEADVL